MAMALLAAVRPAGLRADPPEPVRVGSGRILEPRKLKNVAPEYPRAAKAAGLEGIVILEATIDPEGRVSDVRALRDIPPLTAAATKAVRQWRYTPTLLDGVAVPVIMTVTVNFKIDQVDFYGLLGSLRDNEETIRASAAATLGNLRAGIGVDEGNVQKAVRELEGVVAKDRSERVRAAAAHSLSKLDGRPLPPGVAPADPPRPESQPFAWGRFVDPVGDAGAKREGTRIVVSVPSGNRDLAIESRAVAAPRLLQVISGDFQAEVTVDALPSPGPPLGRVSFRGAGLLLWQDEKNYVRLESATYRLRSPSGAAAYGVAPVADVRYALFEVRRDGRPDRISPADVRLDEGRAQFRLERRGRRVIGLVRQGGSEWRRVGQADVDLPDTVEIGLAAVSIAHSGLLAGFDEYQVWPLAATAAADEPPVPPLAAAEPASDPAPLGVGDSGSPMVMDYDSPPRPKRITRPEYPRAAEPKKLEGTVLVEILIDSHGRVVRARVLTSVPGLDEAALACVHKWTFEPARKNGKAVATIAQAPIVFRIH
jgi:TonB family protein